MKKKSLKKLVLNRETVAKLADQRLEEAQGGNVQTLSRYSFCLLCDTL